MECIVCHQEKVPSVINRKYCDDCAQKSLDKMVEWIKENNPLWKEEQEFGRLCQSHIEHLTDVELERYNELKNILTKGGK